ncbi:MAG: hypothetical protein WBN57_07780 [Gammaproteobacteria bacterium]
MNGIALKLLITSFLVLAGCVSSVDIRSMLDQSVGESITVFRGGKPIEVRSHGPTVDDYLYESDQTGCKVALTVDKQTKIVKSWHYLGDPELCRKRHVFGHPW